MKQNESILIKDDPVRPRFSYEWRTSLGREVWVWENDTTGDVDAIVCTAYTNDIPTSEDELELFSMMAAINGGQSNTAVFYTIWSYKPGSGRTLLNSLAAELCQSRRNLTRWVTLSPITEMATQFHLRNGATLLQVNSTTQNFDYTAQVQRLVNQDSYSSSM